MNPKVLSIITATLGLIAMMLIAFPRFMGASISVDTMKSKEKSIALPTGVTLSYVEHGKSDGIPLILLHGFTDSWHSYGHLLRKFPNKFRVIALSQRGHGNSTKTARTDHVGFFAADLAAFIREKNLGACTIVGHSLGGLITQQFALDYPELTRAVVIVASEASFADNQGITEFVGELKKLTDPVDPKFAEGFQWSTIVKPLDSAMVDEFIGESMKVPAKVWNSVGHLLMTTDCTKNLHTIQAPALILWGDKDSICLWKGQQELNHGLQNSKLVVYKGTGHALHWEEGERFVNDVVSFVNSVQ
jgi:non-heme chloroperoxidase